MPEIGDSSEELIRQRYSCRNYVDRPIDPTIREALSERLASLSAGPFESQTRFSLVAATENDRTSLKGLGTYGTIKGAPGFIVGAARPGQRDLEDYGYCMEQAVLAATGLGLQTCWLGGSFTKSSFARKIGAARDEIVPAVVAVGYPADGSRGHWIRSGPAATIACPTTGSSSKTCWTDPCFCPLPGSGRTRSRRSEGRRRRPTSSPGDWSGRGGYGVSTFSAPRATARGR